jgi:hypothetical protein
VDGAGRNKRTAVYLRHVALPAGGLAGNGVDHMTDDKYMILRTALYSAAAIMLQLCLQVALQAMVLTT